MDRPPIPEGADQITAEWLSRALEAGGALEFPPIEDVVTERIGVGVGVVGTLLRCRLAYRDSAGSAPESVIVKLPSSDPKTLRLSKSLNLYKRELDYYRFVAPHAPVRSPTMFYGDLDRKSDRFVLVLEDLDGMETMDQIEGASPERARMAIRAAARLHGRYWNKTNLPPLAGFYKSLALRNRIVLQIIYLKNLIPAFRNFGELFSDDTRRLAEAYGLRIADQMSDAAAGPMTLMHGDFRLDNMFFGADGEDDFALIDWQVCAVGNGLYDVAYFLAGSVTPEVRREIEREALEEYHRIVRSMGAKDFTFEECWNGYRRGVLSRLLISVIAAGGLDTSEERGPRLLKVMVERSIAAIEDLNADELMPAPRPLLSPANLFSALSATAYRVMKAMG